MTVEKQPTPEQIKKFVKSVESLALFAAVHHGQEAPDLDLVAVMRWLKGLCAGLHSPPKKEILDADSK